MKQTLLFSVIAFILHTNAFAHSDHSQGKPDKAKTESSAKASPAPSPSPTKKHKHTHKEHDHGNDDGHDHSHGHDHNHGHSHDHGHNHGHHHAAPRVISKEQAMGVALGASKRLTTHDVGLPFGLLPESWGNLSEDKSTIHETGDGYFIVKVKNDSEKKTLFLLIGTNGNVYDANFTGEFEVLKQQKPSDKK